VVVAAVCARGRKKYEKLQGEPTENDKKIKIKKPERTRGRREKKDQKLYIKRVYILYAHDGYCIPTLIIPGYAQCIKTHYFRLCNIYDSISILEFQYNIIFFFPQVRRLSPRKFYIMSRYFENKQNGYTRYVVLFFPLFLLLFLSRDALDVFFNELICFLVILVYFYLFYYFQ